MGQLQAQYSETYTFDAQTNYSSAAKVWVNGQLVFNNLDSTPANNQITLVAGQNYDFRVQLQAGYDYPDVHVYWSSPSTPHQVIPASALFMPESGVGILPSNVAGPVVTGTGINTLALDDTTGSWNLAGGDIRGGTVTTSGAAALNMTASSTLDGVTLDTNLSVPSTTTLTVLDGLTLNGTLTETRSDFYNSTYVNFSGTQTLSGTGSVVFVQSGPRVYYAPTNYFQPTNGGTLTIGAGITIDGQEGVVGNGSLPLINDGSILADQPGQTITVTGSTVTNQGTLGAQNGGVMNIVGSTIVNQGALEAGPGTTLNLNGAWTNAVGSTIAGNGDVGPGEQRYPLEQRGHDYGQVPRR